MIFTRDSVLITEAALLRAAVVRNKIEIFACLIAHQLQCFACRLLFGFLLAASAALADDIAVEVHLYGEVLVMVGAMLAGKNVFEPFTGFC